MDDVTGVGGEVDTEVQGGVEAPEAPAVEAAPSTPEPVSQPAQPQFDPNQFAAQFQQYQEHSVRQMQAALESQRKQFDDRLMQILAPDQYAKQNQPKHLTVDEFQRHTQEMQSRFQQELQAREIRAQFTSELEMAKREYSDVFSDNPLLEKAIRQEFIETGRSPREIAKQMADLEQKRFEARQAKYIQQKQTVAKHGAPVKGTPAPAVQDSGLRGKARLMALRGVDVH